MPFLADSVPLLYEKIKQDSVKFPENHKVTENLKSCIVQMLEKNPTQRITIPQLKVLNELIFCIAINNFIFRLVNG